MRPLEPWVSVQNFRLMAEDAFDCVDAPIARVIAPDIPGIPGSPLEKSICPRLRRSLAPSNTLWTTCTDGQVRWQVRRTRRPTLMAETPPRASQDTVHQFPYVPCLRLSAPVTTALCERYGCSIETHRLVIQDKSASNDFEEVGRREEMRYVKQNSYPAFI